MPIDRDFLHEYAKNPQVPQAARSLWESVVFWLTVFIFSLYYNNILLKYCYLLQGEDSHGGKYF
jgi:hypothetical protein